MHSYLQMKCVWVIQLESFLDWKIFTILLMIRPSFTLEFSTKKVFASLDDLID